MRTTPAAVAGTVTAAFVAALTLTACSGGESDGSDAKSPADDKPAACEAGKFAIDFGPGNPAPAVGDTGNIPVTLTNNGTACVLRGVPATKVFAGSTSWAVGAEESSQAQKLTLAEGAAATFTITYVRGAAGDPAKGAEVDTVKFTLPGDSAEQSYEWPDAEIAVKSEKELDITVSPILPSGD
ncbi:DUF4232 domain-containing protein [Streptomyces phyllanthi]|uniref:DUF4232 domain-containing protein n=1 Tax=Streptomyces phyllanthi TaxID=1803180 RepID=A0A5N8WET4_9ACTN|nr:DUF4232 domain-containing protein [Streptomyces phyllanthi]MPY46003.1 DUF4232 domain-containing protein [Streptomyces phyllanthi]